MNELYHHGVKGQKWGVRRYRDENGNLILPKNTIVKRVSTNKADYTYDNKKYVSINQEDHSKWDKYIGEAYVNRNIATWTQTYKTVKDLKVMSSTKQGELYIKMLMDKNFKKQAIKDTDYASKSLGLATVNDAAENISRNIAMQTQTGKAFINRVLADNYDAIVDTHGTKVSKDPLVVLNPDTNLVKVSDPEYTESAKNFLRQYGIAC